MKAIRRQITPIAAGIELALWIALFTGGLGFILRWTIGPLLEPPVPHAEASQGASNPTRK